MSMIPVVGDDGLGRLPGAVTPVGNSQVGYQTVVTTLQQGAAIQIRPILCGSDQVLLDLHSRVVELETIVRPEGKGKQPAVAALPAQPRDAAAVVDRPSVMTHRLDTTLRMPLGKRMLVGGITSKSVPEPGEPNLYLFAKTTVNAPPAAAPAKARRK
jgi:hypothetical protein